MYGAVFSRLAQEAPFRTWRTSLFSNNLLPLGSLVYLLFCVTRYGWGWDNFIKEADLGNGVKFPKWARPYLTYVLPLIVLLIFVMGYYDKFFR